MLVATKLIDKRLDLFYEKEKFVNNLAKCLKKKSFFNSFENLNKLKRILNEELKINNLLIDRVERPPLLERYVMSKLQNEKIKLEVNEIKKIIDKLAKNLTKTDEQIFLQQEILKKISPFKIKIYSLFPLEFNKYFNQFKESYYIEKVSNKKIIDFSKKEYPLLKKELKKLEKEKQVLKSHQKLIREIIETYKLLIKSVGDEARVRLQHKKIEKLISSAKRTSLYSYMKNDFDTLRTKINYVVKHPKESKLAYAAVTAYIILPTTFELTFVLLFLRYSTKLFFDFSKIRKRL